jgi:hypothetical protein
MSGAIPPLPQYAFMAWGSVKGRRKDMVSRLALELNQPPIKCVPGALSPGLEQLGHELTTHLYLVPRLIMHGTIPPLPQMSSCYDVYAKDTSS